MADAPHHVRWSDHAYAKAELLGAARTDIESALLERHTERRRNTGAAQWRLLVGRWVVLYDHPDRNDPTAARIVTLWRRR